MQIRKTSDKKTDPAGDVSIAQWAAISIGSVGSAGELREAGASPCLTAGSTVAWRNPNRLTENPRHQALQGRTKTADKYSGAVFSLSRG
jgi:hypothetical protein